MESEMPTQHIDFKYIRQHADIVSVAEHFGLKPVKDGSKDGQYRCFCPFHDDHNPSLKLNRDRNIFNCFVCDEGGNVLDFVKEHEGIELRPAAKMVAEICGIATSDRSPSPNGKKLKKPEGKKHKNKKTKKAKPEPDPISGETDRELEELDGEPYNKPLTFELKNLITEHPWLEERGILEDEIKHFGMGIAQRGVMKDRLVFPIHDAKGNLVAYCGRYVGDDVPKDEAKYKQPTKFRKELELFNFCRTIQLEPDMPLILVESFFSAIKLHMLSYRAAALMGRSMSEAQLKLLKDAGETSVMLFLDGDDPGRAAVTTIGRQLLEEGFEVTAPVVAEDFKPHRCSTKKLEEIVGIPAGDPPPPDMV